MEAKNYCYNNFESVIMQEKKQYFKNFANSLPPHKIIVSENPDQNVYLINSQAENSVLENSVLIIDENYNKKKIIFNKSSKNFPVSENVIKLECMNNDKIGHEIVLNEEVDKSKDNCTGYAFSNRAEEVKVADNKLQFSKIDDTEIFNEFQISQANNVIIASQIYIENNPSQNFNVTKDSQFNSFINAKQKNSDAPKKLANLLSCSKVVSYKQKQLEKESENLLNSETFAKNINLEKLNCFYCGKHFNKLFNLQQHERIHTGERPFQCIICGRAFSQKSNVIKHMSRHKVWPSTTLTINFKPNKKNHHSMKENLMELMNYSCQYCSLSFKSYSLLKKHLISHSDVKVYRCIQKTCYETFKDIDEFLLHSKKHSTAEFTCHICLKSFTNLGDLGEHQYEHNKNDTKLTDLEKKKNSKRLKCKICCAQFKSIQSYQNHMAVDTHKYECVQCKNVFSSERALRRHLNLHIREQTAFETNISQLECQLCKKTFHSKKTLKTHESVHLNENSFNCDQCHKEFSTKSRLQRHLSSHLNFECPYKSILGCDKTFLTKDNLKDHVNSHNQSRKCKVCLKTFSSFSKMNQHFEKEHFHKSNKKSPRSNGRPQVIRKKQKRSNQHRCIVDDKKIKRTKIREQKSDKETETVSNIEIIMVPYFS